MMKIKGSKSQIFGLINIHIDRSNEDPDHQRDRGNENIDPLRSHLNYNLIDRDDPYRYASDRLDALEKEQKDHTGRGFRSDAVIACSTIVYLPEGYENRGLEFERQFFQGCTNYALDKFGPENVLTAIVHKDENRPHIHIVSLPIVKDQERERLCFKEAFTRQDYREMHPELERYIREQTKDKDIKIYDPLKEKTKTVSKERYILNDENKKLERERQELQRQKEQIDRAKEQQRQEVKAYYNYNKEVDRYCERYGLTDAQYQREIYINKMQGYYPPEPEKFNPDRSEKERALISKAYEEQQHEKDHQRER